MTESSTSVPSHRTRRVRRRVPLGVTVLSGVAVLFFALPFAGLLWRVRTASGGLFA